MLDHFTFDRPLETARFLLEDFVSTCPSVYLSVDGELHDATAMLRGHAVALTLQAELELTGDENLALCCPHATGLYRFRMDLVDDAGTVLTLVRSVNDPLSRRISVRGKIAIEVEMRCLDSHLGAPRRGITQDLSRGGMSVVMDCEMPVTTDWEVVLHLWQDEKVTTIGRVVRRAENVDGKCCYGVAFTHSDKAAERKVLDFVLANADITTEESV